MAATTGPGAQPEPFGPYLLLRPLGRGGMGVVYVARSRRTDHPIVAVKRLRADAALVPSFRERFDHECALALRLRHPRIVEALDAGEVHGVPYVASELIQGQDVGAIAERLADRGRGAPTKVAIRIMIDVLSGLDYVHQAREPTGRPLQLVHRDVTPGNVLVGYDGFGRVADFGLAKSLLTEQLQLTATGTILGTPKFLAPEVASGSPASPQSDLYGLGAVMYRLLVGRGPYEGDAREVLEAVLQGPPRPLRPLRPDLPPWLVELVEQLMARAPEDRPTSARAAGLVLVDRARHDDGFLARPRLGQWLQELFALEWRQQSEQLRRDRQVDVDRVPAGEGTRVLASPQAPLEGPSDAPSDDGLDYDGRTLRRGDLPEPSPPLQPTALPQGRPGPDHDRTASPAPTTSPAARPSRLDGPTRLWAHLETPPAPSAAPLVAPTSTEPTTASELRGSFSARPWLALAAVAVLAAGVGAAVGNGLRRPDGPVQAYRLGLAERLGQARRSVAELRARGAHVEPTIDARLERIKQLLLTSDDLTRAQLELQDLELALQNMK